MKKRILCLESDENILDFICRILESRLGFAVERATTLDEAGNKLGASAFDLFTMSLAFPVEGSADHPHGLAGLTFLRELREGRFGEGAGTIPVLVLSGTNNLWDKVGDARPERDNIWSMHKPFSYLTLKNVVHEALGLYSDADS